MRAVAQRFKAEELAIVRDFMREAKEVFQRQISGLTHPENHVSEGVRGVRRPSRLSHSVRSSVGWYDHP